MSTDPNSEEEIVNSVLQDAYDVATLEVELHKVFLMYQQTCTGLTEAEIVGNVLVALNGVSQKLLQLAGLDDEDDPMYRLSKGESVVRTEEDLTQSDDPVEAVPACFGEYGTHRVPCETCLVVKPCRNSGGV